MKLCIALVCCAILGTARSALGEDTVTRALLTPSTAAPARVLPGGVLSMVVRVASGLTPPPGIQQERALESFAARLCADGVAIGTAPSRACSAVAVTNVRPQAAHSLDYRVDVPLPAWLAPGSYDLGVRFPGASVDAPASVRVGEHAASAHVERDAEGLSIRAPADAAAIARLHVSGRAIAVEGGAVEVHPLPDASGRFREAFVALVRVPLGQRARVRERPAAAWPACALELPETESGQSVTLAARPLPTGAQVFWWLEPWRGAVGSRAEARFVAPRAHPVEALWVDPSRGARLVRGEVNVRARRVGSCSAAHASRPSARPFVLGLLALALSWKLGARRGRRAAFRGRERAR